VPGQDVETTVAGVTDGLKRRIDEVGDVGMAVKGDTLLSRQTLGTTPRKGEEGTLADFAVDSRPPDGKICAGTGRAEFQGDTLRGRLGLLPIRPDLGVMGFALPESTIILALFGVVGRTCTIDGREVRGEKLRERDTGALRIGSPVTATGVPVDAPVTATGVPIDAPVAATTVPVDAPVVALVAATTIPVDAPVAATVVKPFVPELDGTAAEGEGNTCTRPVEDPATTGELGQATTRTGERSRARPCSGNS